MKTGMGKLVLPVLAGLFFAGTSTAEAGRHYGYGSYGSSGSSGSSGGGSSGGSSSSGSSGYAVTYGSSSSGGSSSSSSGGGLFSRLHKWIHGPKYYYTYGSGSSSSSSSSGSSGYYGGSSSSSSGSSSSGSSGSSGYSAMYYTEEPAVEATPGTQPVPNSTRMPAAPDAGGNTGSAPESALLPDAQKGMIALKVHVPEDAKVYVNEMQTKSTGEVRSFRSKGLVPGQKYLYTVRVERDVDGEPVVETKTVQVTAGRAMELRFGGAEAELVRKPETVKKISYAPAEAGESFALDATEPRLTTLVLHVPADAVVHLAGRKTKATGEVRYFSTDKLPTGQTWLKYPVRVEMEVEGRTVVQEQVVSLAAGETREVTFSPESDDKLVRLSGELSR